VTHPRPDSRRFRATAALLLSGLLAIAAVGGTWAAPLAVGLDAPTRAFDWPADGAPNDPYFGLQADLLPIGVAAAWATTTGAPTTVVAVLDTGIEASNAEFRGRIVPGYNALTGAEAAPGAFAATADDNGHGTHVSGTIAAAANNSAGIAGIAPDVLIMPIKVLNADGEGDFGLMRDGMNWAVAHGARIITMSLGGTLNSSAITLLQPTFTAAHSAGAIVVAASGNDGAAVDEYPCNFTYVICVGSTTKDGSAVSSFSSRTPAVALVAPGEQIASTVPGGYGYGSGTSMATPHVTGAVALLRSIRPELSPDEAMAILTQTARPLVDGGRNPDSGFGLLQVGAAVAQLTLGATATPTPSPTPTPDPNATPTPTPDPNAAPTPDPSINPVPAPIAIVPAVTAALPANGTRSVARSVRPRITFSVPMVGVSTSTIRLKDLSRGRWVTIRVTYSASSRTATIIPAARLAANHSYRITVGGALAASGGAGLSRTYVVTFRSGYR
jgi:subtilisin family serine protease